MPIPVYAQQAFLALRSERQAARPPSGDGGPELAPTPASREEPAPSGVPAGVVFHLARRVAPFLVLIALAGCATPKRGAYCRDWCEPLDLLAVYSDGTCVCSVGPAKLPTRATPMPPSGQFGETTKIAPSATEVRP